jgi:hypothetical protein
MSDFIPTADDALTTWMANLKKKLPVYAPTLNISTDDVTIYQNEYDALTAAILDVDDGRKQFKYKVQVKDDLRSDTVSNIRTLVNRIKTEKNYTDAIGKDLGIIGTQTVIDLSTAKPALTATIAGGQVIISFKRGQSNGIKLYSKRGSETVFTFLALDTHSPYHDTRANLTEGVAEIRQYYAFYIDNHDAQVGLQSDAVTITI